MTLGDIASKVRYQTKTDTTSYPDAQLLIDINITYEKIIGAVLRSMDEQDFDDYRSTSNYPIASRALVAGQRDYKFNSNTWSLAGREGGSATTNQPLLPLKIKRVDVTYDGTNYFRADPIDTGEISIGLGNDTVTDASYYKTAPKYDIRANAINVYPMATAGDVSSGAKVRIEFTRDVTLFVVGDYTSVLTDSTVIPAFDSTFHPSLANGTCYEYGKTNNLPNKNDWKQDFNEDMGLLALQYGSKAQDRNYRLGVDPYTVSYK